MMIDKCKVHLGWPRPKCTNDEANKWSKILLLKSTQEKNMELLTKHNCVYRFILMLMN